MLINSMREPVLIWQECVSHRGAEKTERKIPVFLFFLFVFRVSVMKMDFYNYLN